MCYEATCATCKKRTWDGCGAHKDAVMRGIPKAQQCECPEGLRKPEGSCSVM